MYGALIFDLDDTLYSERDFAFSGFRAVSKVFAESHGVNNLYDICVHLFDTGTKIKLFDRALDQLGVEAKPDTIASLVRVYRQHQPEISLPEDTSRFLDNVNGLYGIGIITDGIAATQRAKAEALRLGAFADLIICTDELGKDYWKPHPRAYIAMEEHFGFGGSRMVYIGDNPAKDFITPNERGWLTIQINRLHRVHPETTADTRFSAKETIESFDALAPILDRRFPDSRQSGSDNPNKQRARDGGLYCR